MRLHPESDLHLSYCLNAFDPPRPENFESYLQQTVLPLKSACGWQQPMGVGLWLNHEFLSRLSGQRRDYLLEALNRCGLYLFTLNGFPYGRFHRSRVKERVFTPDWSEPERLLFTLQLAELAAQTVPPEGRATISTVPLGYRNRFSTEKLSRAADLLWEAALKLNQIRERSGVILILALEPEPDAVVETADETIGFLTDTLLPHARRKAGVRGEEVVRRHIGLCLDLAHLAVVGESLESAVASCRQHGVIAAKIHLSRALCVFPATGTVSLHAFADDTYLHQVRAISQAGDRLRWPDLPAALSDPRFQHCREARVHFHVPLFWQGSDGMQPSSLPAARGLRAAVEAGCHHFEVETYTWKVIPAEDLPGSVIDAAARELRLARSLLLSALGHRPKT